MGFQAPEFAQAMRDVIRQFIKSELEATRPPEAYATVEDITGDYVTVRYPGAMETVQARLFTIRPNGLGAVVRLEGSGNRRYVSEVVNGSSLVRAGNVAVTAISSTANAANVFVDTISGRLYQVVSSLRFKKNVETISVSEEKFLELRAISYQPITDTGDDRYLGLIAEEIAALNDPVLDQLVLYAGDEPQSIHYDRLSVVMLPIIQRLLQRVAELEQRVDTPPDHA